MLNNRINMKILIANAIYPTKRKPYVFGGAEKSVQKIAEALAQNGDDVTVLRAVAKNSEGARYEEANGVEVVDGSVRNIYFDFPREKKNVVSRLIWHVIDDWYKAPALAEELLSSGHYDILYTNTLTGITTDIWRIANREGVPIVHTLRDYYLLCPKCTCFRNGKNCNESCLSCKVLTVNRRDATKYVDAVIGNSEFILQKHLDQGLFAEATLRKVIHSISEVTNNCNSKRSIPNIGYIGRLNAAKGIRHMVDEFIMARGDERLIVAGSGDPGLIDHIESVKNCGVDYIGFVRPEEFYDRVDIVVVPSLWHEPLPRAAIDALAAGKLVVGAERGGIPELLRDRDDCWIYDPASRGALANSIQQATKAFYSGKRGKGYGPRSNVMEQYRSVFSTLIGDRRNGNHGS